MTASSASKEFGRYIDTVQREPVVITKQNRPVAVTLSIQDAEHLFQHKIESGVARGLADVEAGKFNELTPAYLSDLKARFKAKMK